MHGSGGMGNPEHHVGHRPGSRGPLISFAGEIGRLGFLAWTVGALLVIVAFSYVGARFFLAGVEGIAGVLDFFGALIFVLMILAAAARRFRDTGRTGWLTLLLLIPIFQLLPLVYLLVAPGRIQQYSAEPAPEEPDSPPYRPYQG